MSISLIKYSFTLNPPIFKIFKCYLLLYHSLITLHQHFILYFCSLHLTVLYKFLHLFCHIFIRMQMRAEAASLFGM